MKTPLLILSLILSYESACSQTPLAGTWDGDIRVGGRTIGIHVTFRDTAGTLSGAIDIPQQGAHDLALQNVTAAGAVIHFELPTGMAVAKFDGTIESDSLTGMFSQGGAMGTFALLPAPVAAARKAPEPPPPYVQEDVTFRDGDITLAGTLTIPPSAGRHPAVVLLTGSGPENRDEDIIGFKIFKIIADRLTRDGIAVLRFDDRGVGGSSGNQSDCTTDDYAGDALAGVSFLAADRRIDDAHIGIVGHSEGAIAAAIAASRNPGEIAAVVLLAGPGLRGDSLINNQIVELSKKAGQPEENIRQTLALQHKVYEAIHTGGAMTEVQDRLSAAAARSYAEMTPTQRAAFADSAAYVSSSVERNLAATRSRWFRRFIDIDPVTYLQKLQCPVLALFGELDNQVFPAINEPPVRKALAKNKDATFTLIPTANHLFQSAHTGAPSEYGSLSKDFAPGFLDAISRWHQKRLIPRG